MSDYDNIDTELMNSITAVRTIHHACTARYLSDRLRISRNVVRNRLGVLRERGFVTWTDVAGSLRLTDAGEQVHFGKRDGEPPVEESLRATPSTDHAEADEAQSPAHEPEPAKAATGTKTPARKKAAKKKAAARKKPAA